MRSDYLKLLNDQVLPSGKVFFPDDVEMCIFKDDNSRIPRDRIVRVVRG